MLGTITSTDETKDLHDFGHPEATHQIRHRLTSAAGIYKEGIINTTTAVAMCEGNEE